MKIAVLSDIHDHIDKLRSSIEIIKEKGCQAVIFCGDMISPFTTGVLSSLQLPTYAVLGNNDEDHIGMVKKGGDKFTWFHLSQEFGKGEFEARKIAFGHYPKLAELLAISGEYDAVFFGHTHKVMNKMVGNTLLLNPGAVCGINFDTGEYDQSTFAVYGTATNTAEIVEIK